MGGRLASIVPSLGTPPAITRPPINALLAYIDRIIAENYKVISEMQKFKEDMNGKESGHENR